MVIASGSVNFSSESFGNKNLVKQSVSVPASPNDYRIRVSPLTGVQSGVADGGTAPLTILFNIFVTVYEVLATSLLQIRHLRRGYVSCLLSVKPSIANFYGSLHGGAVAAVAETLSFPCARTVVAEDKELFLGELAMSYLSAAPQDANVYHATKSDGREFAIKVYKASILVFKNRDRYVQGDYRFRHGYCKYNPRKMVKTWAEKEMRNL